MGTGAGRLGRCRIAFGRGCHLSGARLVSAVAVMGLVVGIVATAPMVASADHGLSHAVRIISVDFTEGEGCVDFPELCVSEDGQLVPAHGGQWELNLAIPEGCAEPLPVFIDNPGSAWSSTDTNGTSHPMTDHCYAFAGVNDSASSLCTFPCQAWDMNAAIRWLRANADGWVRPDDHTVSEDRPAGQVFEYHLDPNRIAVSGFSSGGWQAAFAGTTNGATFVWDLPGEEDEFVVDLEGTLGPWEGIHSSDVQAVVPLHAPTDFSLMDPPHHGVGPPSVLVHNQAGSPESNLVGCTVGTSRPDNPTYTYDPECEAKVQSANPIHYISHDDPPQMVFHGSSDSLVPHGQSVYLYEALRDHCRTVSFYSMDAQNHVPIYMGLEPGAPYTYFETQNCGSEQVGHGPPEDTVHLPDLTPYTRDSANWRGVARFLDRVMRETTPPDLRVDASGNPPTAHQVLANGHITVQVQTDEASWYDAVAVKGGREIGTASVDIYDWGAGYPTDAPSPYATTITIPISHRGGVASGGDVTVHVTARDRVANEITVSDTFHMERGRGCRGNGPGNRC